jgi:hypothetical protein
MVLATITAGPWHFITGTAQEVLNELQSRGARPLDVPMIKSDGTAAVFRMG